VRASDRALFILNEGGATTASLDAVVFHESSTIRDSAGKVDTLVKLDTTYSRNIVPNLGGYGNDIIVSGNAVYTLMSGTGEIVVISADSLKKTGSILFGSASPNKMALIAPNKLLVTQRGKNSAAIIDLTTNLIVDSIDVGESNTAVGVLGGKAFISSGLNTLNVVDLATKQVTKKLHVGFSPETVLVDSAHGQIILGCVGEFSTNPPSTIYYVSASSASVTDSVVVGTKSYVLGNIILGGSKLFALIDGSVFSNDLVSRGALTPLFVNPTGISYYNGMYDAARDNLYLGQYEFSKNGAVDVYGQSGTFKRSFGAGIAPAHFALYR
jgi:hypothetical protein